MPSPFGEVYPERSRTDSEPAPSAGSGQGLNVVEVVNSAEALHICFGGRYCVMSSVSDRIDPLEDVFVSCRA